MSGPATRAGDFSSHKMPQCPRERVPLIPKREGNYARAALNPVPHCPHKDSPKFHRNPHFLNSTSQGGMAANIKGEQTMRRRSENEETPPLHTPDGIVGDCYVSRLVAGGL
jgi:hypothetical protein